MSLKGGQKFVQAPRGKRLTSRVTPRVLGSVLGGRSVASEVQNSNVARVFINHLLKAKNDGSGLSVGSNSHAVHQSLSIN